MKSRKDIRLDNYHILPRLFNVEEYISRLVNPIVLNRFVGPNCRERVIDACISKKEDKDIIFSCDCGNLEGNFLKGSRCEKCNTYVKEARVPMNDVIFEIPFGHYVLHPLVYLMLKDVGQFFKHVNNILDLSKPLSKELQDLGIDDQGWIYLRVNFFRILNLIKDNLVPKAKRARAEEIINFFYVNQHIIFINKIVLSGNLHTRETSGNKHSIADTDINPILEQVWDMLLYQSRSQIKVNTFDKELYTMYLKYIEYLAGDNGICKTRISKKEGYGRGNIYGTSIFFSMRAVINPIIDPHEADEIHISWEAAMEMLSLHLINKLTKKHGMSTREAIEYKNRFYITYDELIDQCFKEIIADSPFKGLPALMNRNPSIKIGSIVLVFITKILPGCRCLKLSDLILPEMNGDNY